MMSWIWIMIIISVVCLYLNAYGQPVSYMPSAPPAVTVPSVATQQPVVSTVVSTPTTVVEMPQPTVTPVLRKGATSTVVPSGIVQIGTEHMESIGVAEFMPEPAEDDSNAYAPLYLGCPLDHYFDKPVFRRLNRYTL